MPANSLEIKTQQNLAPYNAFGFVAKAEYMALIQTTGDLTAALTWAHKRRLAVRALGAGTNVVITEDLPGLTLLVRNTGIQCLEETASEAVVRLAAGENWHQSLGYCLARGWFGLENLALIPGNVGAAPVQNIGAYGVEMSEYCEAVNYVDPETGQYQRLSASACEFGYRDSCFKQSLKGRAIIESVEFRLPKVPRVNLSYQALGDYLVQQGVEQPTPLQVYSAVSKIRQGKLPAPETLGNAGSFFKNPVVNSSTLAALKNQWPDLVAFAQPDQTHKISAGWLIERCGWKGHVEQGVGVYEKQALVLVNHGAVSAAPLLALVEKIRTSVQQRFNLWLEIEPVFLP